MFESYHCPTPQHVRITDIDPSLAIGFYCDTRSMFDEFISHLQDLICSLPNPVLSIQKTKTLPIMSTMTVDDEDDDLVLL